MQYRLVMFAPFITALPLLCTSAGDGLCITEIMYDPASTEQRGESEWIELANLGSTTIDLEGWRFDDEDASDWGPLSGQLKPGHIAIVFNGDATSVSEFLTAWTDDPNTEPAFLLLPVPWGSLANKPTADNEILQLIDADDNVACTVNYQRGGDWPDPRRRGESIHLVQFTEPVSFEANNWALTKVGQPGARIAKSTATFNKPDVGSPGFIPTSIVTKPPPPVSSTPAPKPAEAPKTKKSPPPPPLPPVEDDDVPY